VKLLTLFLGHRKVGDLFSTENHSLHDIPPKSLLLEGEKLSDANRSLEIRLLLTVLCLENEPIAVQELPRRRREADLAVQCHRQGKRQSTAGLANTRNAHRIKPEIPRSFNIRGIALRVINVFTPRKFQAMHNKVDELPPTHFRRGAPGHINWRVHGSDCVGDLRCHLLPLTKSVGNWFRLLWGGCQSEMLGHSIGVKA
jgi:hypothetical protein